MTFSRQANPVWLFTDLEGNILDDNYWISFLQNTLPYLPQDVFHDDQGLVPWANPLQFYPDGTLPDNLYFTDGEVYRLEIRRGPLQSDPLIRLIQNFVGGEGDVPVTASFTTESQVTNPQFAIVYFNDSVVINNNGNHSYDIAPGWVLDLESSAPGVITITRLPIAGNDPIPTSNTTNPSYVLKVEVTSGIFTVVNLRQRFDHAPALWAGKYVSVTLVAKVLAGVGFLTATYTPSDGGTAVQIIGESLSTLYQLIAGSQLIDLPSFNSDTAATGYVDMVFALPVTGTTFITNVQIVASDVAIGNIGYIETSVERQIDHTFNVYRQPLMYKPIPSYLVGWDFPLNPAQTGATVAATAIGANQSKYVWDQTIIFQSADSGVGVTRGSAGEIVLTAAVTAQMAIIQYLDAAQARKILNDRIAANISGKASIATTGTVSLWYTTDASLPDISDGTNDSLVLTLDVNGKPATFNGTWTEVPRPMGLNAQFTLETNATTNFNDYMFNNWDMEGIAACNTATFFAIVVGFASVTTPGTISINSAGLMAGDIATRPAPQTPDEVLRECEYYYEKSYEPGIAEGAVTNVGVRFNKNDLIQNGGNWSNKRRPFGCDFMQAKRIVPTMRFYAPDGATADRVSIVIRDGTTELNRTAVAVVGSYAAFSASTTNFYYIPSNTAEVSTAGGFNVQVQYVQTEFHYVADARLGF